MAQIMKANSKLQHQAKIYQIVLIVLYLATFLAFLKRASILPYILGFMTLILQTRSILIIRGFWGERKVFNYLKKLPDDYFIFNDVNISISGHAAQIDHVVLAPDGTVWCVETKSHVGTIYGSDHQKNWLQLKHAGYKSYKSYFYSPVMQNIVHCKRLSEYLQSLTGHKYFVRSVVVFTDGILNVTSKTPVIYPNQLLAILVAAPQKLSYQKNVHQMVQLSQTLINSIKHDATCV